MQLSSNFADLISSSLDTGLDSIWVPGSGAGHNSHTGKSAVFPPVLHRFLGCFQAAIQYNAEQNGTSFKMAGSIALLETVPRLFRSDFAEDF